MYSPQKWPLTIYVCLDALQTSPDINLNLFDRKSTLRQYCLQTASHQNQYFIFRILEGIAVTFCWSVRFFRLIKIFAESKRNFPRGSTFKNFIKWSKTSFMPPNKLPPLSVWSSLFFCSWVGCCEQLFFLFFPFSFFLFFSPGGWWSPVCWKPFGWSGFFINEKERTCTGGCWSVLCMFAGRNVFFTLCIVVIFTKWHCSISLCTKWQCF